MTDLWASLSLTWSESLFLAIICVIAGIVRGFAGFGMSALAMAVAVTIIPPIQLIPILWFQEFAAGILMVRGGWRDANRFLVMVLVLGTWIGWPIGLTLTTSLPVEQSKMIALSVVLLLSALQLGKLRIPGLDTRVGAFLSGIVSGTASGVAHVGGMVVALYVLAQGSAARSMRGTLVLYLLVSSLGGFIFLIGFGVMDQSSAVLGLSFAPVTLIGVWLGTRLFSPRWEPYYRPFCLGLLIFLASVGLLRMLVS